MKNETTQEAHKTKLTLETSGFTDYFLKNYGSTRKFKEESGFFTKHYVSCDSEPSYSNDDPAQVKTCEIVWKEFGSHDSARKGLKLARDLGNYRPFNDANCFCSDTVEYGKSTKRRNCRALCKHLKKMVDKRVNRRVKRILCRRDKDAAN